MNQVKALEDHNWQTIKTAILDPENTVLNEEQQFLLERWVTASRLMDRYPNKKNAIAIHRKKYPEISLTTAYRDMDAAMRLFNSLQTFDFDWWNTWMINNTVDLIRRCMTANDLKSWAAGLAVLKRIIGEKPLEELDPKLIQKHTFIIMVGPPGSQVPVDISRTDHFSPQTRKELSDALFEEVTEIEALEIMNS